LYNWKEMFKLFLPKIGKEAHDLWGVRNGDAAQGFNDRYPE